MRRWRMQLVLTLTLLVGLTFACGDTGGNQGPNPPPEQRPPAALNILAIAQNSPPVFNPVESVWAVKGEDAEIRIFFQDPAGGRGEDYLQLRIDDVSLEARPNGTPIAIGDSVLITVTVVDPSQILFELEPTGLTFNPLAPAELELRYRQADDDLNGDGVVDSDDDDIEQTLSIWRQERVGDDFVRLGSVLFDSLEKIEVELTGFSRYAIAY